MAHHYVAVISQALDGSQQKLRGEPSEFAAVAVIVPHQMHFARKTLEEKD